MLDIQGDIAKQKQFIRSIILADKSKLSWVDSVHTVKCFMAPSLDQFGNPDMIMEAVTTDGEKYVLFIVTTTATYQNSALIMNQLEEKDNLSDTDILYSKLGKLVSEGKINEAENLLFDEIDKSNIEYLRVGIDFYTNLNRLEDKVLEAHNYSREEIEQGLHDLSSEYGINLS